MFAFGETVTVWSAGASTDPYSQEPVEDWENPTPRFVAHVAVEPRPSSEPTQEARNAVVSGFTLYMPTGTAITAQNKVTVRGALYNVLGEPAAWVSPFTGWEPGVVVQVGRTEG